MQFQGSEQTGTGAGRQCTKCGGWSAPDRVWAGSCTGCWSQHYRDLAGRILREGLDSPGAKDPVPGVRGVFLARAVGVFRTVLAATKSQPVIRGACAEGALLGVLDIYPLLAETLTHRTHPNTTPRPEPAPVPEPVPGPEPVGEPEPSGPEAVPGPASDRVFGSESSGSEPVGDPDVVHVSGAGAGFDGRARLWECVECLDRWLVVFDQVAASDPEVVLRGEAAGIARYIRERLFLFLDVLGCQNTTNPNGPDGSDRSDRPDSSEGRDGPDGPDGSGCRVSGGSGVAS